MFRSVVSFGGEFAIAMVEKTLRLHYNGIAI